MDYGKPFGIGLTGGATILGVSVGYGWLILGAVTVTVLVIIAIRTFFRRNKDINSR
jgi:hypothetical protein